MTVTSASAATKFRASEYFPSQFILRDGTFSQLDEAESCHQESLVYCQNLHFLQIAEDNPNVSVIVTRPDLAKEHVSKGLVVVEDPRRMFFALYQQFQELGLVVSAMEFGIGSDCRIHPSAVVSPRARIGNRVHLGAHAVIEDFVHLMDDVSIGANVVVGAEGLITLRHDNGSLQRVRHAGGVEIGCNAEILSGAVIAKSLFQTPTRIGAQSQIGILSNIGHGVTIGERCVISGNAMIAGRTRIEDDVWIGASVSIAQGLTVGRGADVKMGSVVVGHIAPGDVVSGNFAMEHKATMRDFLKRKRYVQG